MLAGLDAPQIPTAVAHAGHEICSGCHLISILMSSREEAQAEAEAAFIRCGLPEKTAK